MSLFPAAAEIAVKHYPCPRTDKFHAGSSRARDVEALDDDVMRGLQEYHPIPVAFGGTVDDAVAWLAHRLEVSVTTVTCVRLIPYHESRVRARHDCDKIPAACCVRCLLH